MVINAWNWYFVQLFSGFFRQFAMSFHTLVGMTFHVVRTTSKVFGFSELGSFSVAPAEFLDSNKVL